MSDDAVYLTTAPNEPLAIFWRELLAEAEIPALVRPGGAGFGGWGSAALMPHDLYVRQSDLARAQEIVAADEGEGEG